MNPHGFPVRSFRLVRSMAFKRYRRRSETLAPLMGWLSCGFNWVGAAPYQRRQRAIVWPESFLSKGQRLSGIIIAHSTTEMVRECVARKLNRVWVTGKQILTS